MNTVNLGLVPKNEQGEIDYSSIKSALIKGMIASTEKAVIERELKRDADCRDRFSLSGIDRLNKIRRLDAVNQLCALYV